MDDSVVLGNSCALESLEPSFNQDLNGDGTIGVPARIDTTLQLDEPLAGLSGSATIVTGATLELDAADSGSVIFQAPRARCNSTSLRHSASYALSNFKFASDGNGGTIVYDLPAPATNASISGQAPITNYQPWTEAMQLGHNQFASLNMLSATSNDRHENSIIGGASNLRPHCEMSRSLNSIKTACRSDD